VSCRGRVEVGRFGAFSRKEGSVPDRAAMVSVASARGAAITQA
jgi:hypothetical protein